PSQFITPRSLPSRQPLWVRSRQSRSRHFHLRGFDSSIPARTAFLWIGIRRCRDKQRPPVSAAEHACERVRLHLDPLGDLAALLHPNHLRHRRTRHPDCILGVQANSVGRTVSQLGPSAAISNAVKRRPNVSPAISVFPSGVIAIPLGNINSSATMRAMPSGATIT